MAHFSPSGWENQKVLAVPLGWDDAAVVDQGGASVSSVHAHPEDPPVLGKVFDRHVVGGARSNQRVHLEITG